MLVVIRPTVPPKDRGEGGPHRAAHGPQAV